MEHHRVHVCKHMRCIQPVYAMMTTGNDDRLVSTSAVRPNACERHAGNANANGLHPSKETRQASGPAGIPTPAQCQSCLCGRATADRERRACGCTPSPHIYHRQDKMNVSAAYHTTLVNLAPTAQNNPHATTLCRAHSLQRQGSSPRTRANSTEHKHCWAHI